MPNTLTQYANNLLAALSKPNDDLLWVGVPKNGLDSTKLKLTYLVFCHYWKMIDGKKFRYRWCFFGKPSFCIWLAFIEIYFKKILFYY